MTDTTFDFSHKTDEQLEVLHSHTFMQLHYGGQHSDELAGRLQNKLKAVQAELRSRGLSY